MNLRKSGGGNRVKAILLSSVFVSSVALTAIPIVEKNKAEVKLQREQQIKIALSKMNKIEEKMSEDKRVERLTEDFYTKIFEENKRIEEEERLEAERMKDYTYRTIKELKQKTGLNVTGFQEYTLELSFYSDLNCENGYGNLTANGERLSAGMVANNFLPFNTKVYMEGHGTKRVTDRGSKRYFTNVTKFDVLVPRNGGESDSSYYKRVNNMGRKHVKGYILELGE